MATFWAAQDRPIELLSSYSAKLRFSMGLASHLMTGGQTGP